MRSLCLYTIVYRTYRYPCRACKLTRVKMANRAYILLFAICIQFGPSLQQLRKLGKRLDYVEMVINSVTITNLKTHDISELRDAIELINNKTEGDSSAYVDVSPMDAAAIADLESEMNKAINQHDLTITAIAKTVSDEKKYVRQQMKALELVKETIANQSIDEIKEMNSKLKEEVHKVKSDLMETKEINSKLKEEVEENKKDILELRQMITEKKKTEVVYSSAAVTVPAHLPSTVVPVPVHLPSTVVPAHLYSCPDGWQNFKDTCYLYVKNERASWDDAKTRCAKRGGKLAEPDTKEKMRYVARLADNRVWLGGTDRHTEGTWVWSSSRRSITFARWWPGEPDNYKRNEDCLYIYRHNLYDYFCARFHRYVCEKQAAVYSDPLF